MRILLVGATGMIGSRVAAEAVQRGHEVTGVSRSGKAPEGIRAEQAAATDAGRIAELAAGHDAIVSAISPPRDGSEPAGPLVEAGRALLEAARRSGVRRVVVVGGAGSLEVAPGVRHVDEPEFNPIYKKEALAQGELLDAIRDEAGDLDWTYISPAAAIAPGERTGVFRVGGDQLLRDADGTSFISAEDYAAGLVDELERGENLRRRISLAY
jgi:putative NADH-flavin reductase